MVYGDPAQPELETLANGAAYLSFCAVDGDQDVRGWNRIQALSIQPYNVQPFATSKRVERGAVTVYISHFCSVRQSLGETESREASD
jgi:hypothetical protein